MLKTKVAVYGSLKRGFPNSSLLKKEKFCGTTKTKNAEYDLLNLIHFPAAIKNGNKKIAVEVYEVSDLTLIKLDILESNGKFYNRELVVLENGEQAFLYFLIDEELIENGKELAKELEGKELPFIENFIKCDKDVLEWCRKTIKKLAFKFKKKT